MSILIKGNLLLLGATPVNPAIPRGFLDKLYAFYPFEGDSVDGWGAFPLELSIDGFFESASLYGPGVAGQCLRASTRTTRPTLPTNWAAGVDYFVGSLRSSTGFVSGSATAFLNGGGEVPALYLLDNATGYGVRSRSSVDVDAELFSVDALSRWTLTIAQHLAAGVLKYHRDGVLNYGSAAASVLTKPTGKLSLGHFFGGDSRPMSDLFVGRGVLTADEVAYLWNGGAGRTITGIIADAGGVTSYETFGAYPGFTGYWNSVDGRTVASSRGDGSDQVSIGSVAHNTGKHWGVFEKFQPSQAVFFTILGFVEFASNANGYLRLDGGGFGTVTASTGFTVGTDPALGAISAGDHITWAVDSDSKKIWFGKNGVFSGDPVAGTGWALSYVGALNLTLYIFGQYGGFSGRFYLTSADVPYANPAGFTPWAD